MSFLNEMVELGTSRLVFLLCGMFYKQFLPEEGKKYGFYFVGSIKIFHNRRLQVV